MTDITTQMVDVQRIRPCTSCGRMTRPMGAPRDGATIQRATADLCATCYHRARVVRKPRSPRAVEIRECVTCHRATRPPRASASDHPGTVIRATADMCMTCYMRDYKRGHMHPSERESHTRPTACLRCGMERTTGRNTTTLCRDCRDVLTEDERAAWAT